MKKILLFLMFCGFIFQIAKAQEGKWQLGIEGGLSSASIPALAYNPGWKNGFMAGVTGQYSFTNKFSLKSGLMYEQKGNLSYDMATDNRGMPVAGSYIYSTDALNYLVVPVLARGEFGHRLKFFINGGPYFGYLLTATYRLQSHVPGVGDYDRSRSEIADFNHADLGLTAGTGLGFWATDKWIMELELRYNQGLTHITTAGTLQNASVNILAGISHRWW